MSSLFKYPVPVQGHSRKSTYVWMNRIDAIYADMSYFRRYPSREQIYHHLTAKYCNPFNKSMSLSDSQFNELFTRLYGQYR
jgi:hypothetical protein